MTGQQAIDRARYLDAQAAKGWPAGYDAADVRDLASECDAALVAEASTPERARELVVALGLK